MCKKCASAPLIRWNTTHGPQPSTHFRRPKNPKPTNHPLLKTKEKAPNEKKKGALPYAGSLSFFLHVFFFLLYIKQNQTNHFFLSLSLSLRLPPSIPYMYIVILHFLFLLAGHSLLSFFVVCLSLSPSPLCLSACLPPFPLLFFVHMDTTRPQDRQNDLGHLSSL